MRVFGVVVCNPCASVFHIVIFDCNNSRFLLPIEKAFAHACPTSPPCTSTPAPAGLNARLPLSGYRIPCPPAAACALNQWCALVVVVWGWCCNYRAENKNGSKTAKGNAAASSADGGGGKSPLTCPSWVVITGAMRDASLPVKIQIQRTPVTSANAFG